MFYMFDSLYLMLLGPPMLLAMWATFKVKTAFRKAKKIRVSSGMSGAEAAAHILERSGLYHVAIEPTNGFLSDHYDPRKKVLRLSPEVYQGRSIAAVGIAAHEVGHAIQDSTEYAPLAFRNGLVPMASIGSTLSVVLIAAGFLLSMFAPAFRILAIVGLGLFGIVVLFQLVNLPVEFNASSRARKILLNLQMVTAEEDRVVGEVLSAAALTYVAATLTAILTLLYYVSRIYGRRN